MRVLYLGGGGYTLPRHIEATFPNASQEVIEIDPGVTRTVYEQLGVDPATTRVVTYNVDGRLMVNQLEAERLGQYDLIIGDAFNDLSIPYHLTTREFDLDLKRVLKEDGYYLALVIDKLQGGKFITAYVETVRSVWPYVYVLADSPAWESNIASTYVVAAGNVPLEEAQLRGQRGLGLLVRSVTRLMPQDLMNAWLAEARAATRAADRRRSSPSVRHASAANAAAAAREKIVRV